MASLAAVAAQKFAGKSALRHKVGDEWVDVDYADLGAAVSEVARGLIDLGIVRGDRVVGLLENCPDAVITWYAVNRLGAIYVPINTAYKGEYLRHQIADSGARLAVCEDIFLADVLAVAPEAPTLEHLLHTGDSSERGTWRGTVSPLDRHRNAFVQEHRHQRFPDRQLGNHLGDIEFRIGNKRFRGRLHRFLIARRIGA